MTDQELLQKSLDYMDDGCGPYTDDYQKLIEAIRARLSQCDRCGEVNPAEIHTCTPKQEPVAWLDEEGYSWIPGELPDEWAKHCKPLYTAPPQREWQGLTDKDIEACLEMSIHGTCRAIEAKLKEKNT